MKSRLFLVLIFLGSLSQCASNGSSRLPSGFSSLGQLDSTIELDLRYVGNNNFIGRPITGYNASACILTTPAAQALLNAQRRANALGYSLKVYDCFRPQRAVDDFVTWASDIDDNRMKASFYPDVPKQELFSRGYIAERSGHSRGSTIDLTLVPLGTRQPEADPLLRDYNCRGEVSERYPDNSIDMGTSYDCFDVLSHTSNPDAGEAILKNRQLLVELMDAAGFNNYVQEWWHFTLRDEPYTDQFFDFPVRK